MTWKEWHKCGWDGEKIHATADSTDICEMCLTTFPFTLEADSEGNLVEPEDNLDLHIEKMRLRRLHTMSEITLTCPPVPIEFIGVHDKFGQSGTPEELLEYYGMGVSHIESAVKKVLDRKGG